jgi:hypothetical protein
MKTVRFSQIVEESGRPEPHLLLVEPIKDRALQRAIKAHRVMTIRQETAGKKDYGIVGFAEAVRGQVLIFPRSLKQFSGKRVVGINYDLIG